MEIQFFGGNCIAVSNKQARVVIDDNLSELGLKSVLKPDDIAIFTQVPHKELHSARLVFTDPGEYEVSEISILGIAARSHMDEDGKKSATIYKIQIGDIRFAAVGHIHPDISEDHLEELGAIDVLAIPVGGNGYTLDPVGALSIIKKIEPKIVIPTHYADSKISYPVPQQPLEESLKSMPMETKELTGKFKPKPVDFTENTNLLILQRS